MRKELSKNEIAELYPDLKAIPSFMPRSVMQVGTATFLGIDPRDFSQERKDIFAVGQAYPIYEAASDGVFVPGGGKRWTVDRAWKRNK